MADTKLGFEFEEKATHTCLVTSAASLHANNAFGVLLLLAPIKRTHAHRHLDALRRHGETYPGSAPPAGVTTSFVEGNEICGSPGVELTSTSIKFCRLTFL